MGRGGGGAGAIVTHLGWGDGTTAHLGLAHSESREGASACDAIRPPGCGVLLGPLIVSAAFAVLIWNEVVYVKREKLVELGEQALMEADCNKLVPQCDGCLVHLSNCPISAEALSMMAPGEQAPSPPPPTPPPGLWATATGLKLSGSVEYWAWEESVGSCT